MTLIFAGFANIKNYIENLQS